MTPPSHATQIIIVTEEMIDKRKWRRRQKPIYRVEELAKFFFGMSASWLRLKMAPDKDHPETWFTDEHGQRLVFRRADPEDTNSARVFWLSDVQPMAESLHRFGQIDNARLAQILAVVQAEAAIFRLFDNPGDPEDSADDDPGEDDEEG